MLDQPNEPVEAIVVDLAKTITDVLDSSAIAKIKSDLAWRGPNDKLMGTVTLTRAQAEALVRILEAENVDER